MPIYPISQMNRSLQVFTSLSSHTSKAEPSFCITLTVKPNTYISQQSEIICPIAKEGLAGLYPAKPSCGMTTKIFKTYFCTRQLKMFWHVVSTSNISDGAEDI